MLMWPPAPSSYFLLKSCAAPAMAVIDRTAQTAIRREYARFMICLLLLKNDFLRNAQLVGGMAKRFQRPRKKSADAKSGSEAAERDGRSTTGAEFVAEVHNVILAGTVRH